MFVGMMHFYF